MSRHKPPLGAPLKGFRETKHGLHCQTQVRVDLPHRKPGFCSFSSFLLPPASHQLHCRNINFLYSCCGDSSSTWGAPQTEVIDLRSLKNKVLVKFLHGPHKSLEGWIKVGKCSSAPIVLCEVRANISFFLLLPRHAAPFCQTTS